MRGWGGASSFAPSSFTVCTKYCRGSSGFRYPDKIRRVRVPSCKALNAPHLFRSLEYKVNTPYFVGVVKLDQPQHGHGWPGHGLAHDAHHNPICHEQLAPCCLPYGWPRFITLHHDVYATLFLEGRVPRCDYEGWELDVHGCRCFRALPYREAYVC